MKVRVYTRDARRPTCDHEHDHLLHSHEEGEGSPWGRALLVGPSRTLTYTLVAPQGGPYQTTAVGLTQTGQTSWRLAT